MILLVLFVIFAPLAVVASYRHHRRSLAEKRSGE